MVQTGTFPNGIINDKGEACRDFILHERAFRHTLELANDQAIKKELLASPTYYDAAIISKRLKVAGIDNMTPEMVLDLEGDDGDTLAQAMMDLDQRRADFRSSQQAAQKATDCPAQTGSPLDRGNRNALGRGGQPAGELPGDCRPETAETEGQKEESLT